MQRTSNRLLTGMLLGMVLGVVVARIAGQVPREAWDRFFPGTTRAEESAKTVIHVVDGDTIVVEGGERIRYLGVDSPEVGEPFYQEAKGFQKRMVLGSRVRIVPCKEEPEDGYGRTLAFVRKGNVDVGEQLLRQGLARTLFMGPLREGRVRALR